MDASDGSCCAPARVYKPHRACRIRTTRPATLATLARQVRPPLYRYIPPAVLATTTAASPHHHAAAAACTMPLRHAPAQRPTTASQRQHPGVAYLYLYLDTRCTCLQSDAQYAMPRLISHHRTVHPFIASTMLAARCLLAAGPSFASPSWLPCVFQLHCHACLPSLQMADCLHRLHTTAGPLPRPHNRHHPVVTITTALITTTLVAAAAMNATPPCQPGPRRPGGTQHHRHHRHQKQDSTQTPRLPHPV